MIEEEDPEEDKTEEGDTERGNMDWEDKRKGGVSEDRDIFKDDTKRREEEGKKRKGESTCRVIVFHVSLEVSV